MKPVLAPVVLLIKSSALTTTANPVSNSTFEYGKVVSGMSSVCVRASLEPDFIHIRHS
jgi:hypothetical protein